MAKSYYTETTVTLNAQQAEQMLDTLRQKTEVLRQSLLAAQKSGDVSKIRDIAVTRLVNHFGLRPARQSAS